MRKLDQNLLTSEFALKLAELVDPDKIPFGLWITDTDRIRLGLDL